LHVKRLGDALYERKLIQSQLINQTNQAFLSNTQSIDETYKYLMDNAVAIKDELNLKAGEPLTLEQQKALKDDIVWMVKKKINNQEVLVPVVYIANIYNYKIQGGQIVADNVDIKSDTINNSGTIKANRLNINSNTITNSAGLLTANDLNINTKNLSNISATIKLII